MDFPVWGLRGNHQPVQNSRTKVGCRLMGSWSFLITLFQIRNPSGPAFLALRPSSTGTQQTSRVRALWGQPCHHGPGVLPSLRVHFPFKVTSPHPHAHRRFHLYPPSPEPSTAFAPCDTPSLGCKLGSGRSVGCSDASPSPAAEWVGVQALEAECQGRGTGKSPGGGGRSL